MKGLLSVSGIKVSGIHCGIKKRKKDLSLIYSENPANWAGVWTKNKVKGASISFNKRRRNNKIQAILINSGNANTGTGIKGLRDVQRMARIAAKSLNIPYNSVLIGGQTGKIGEFLPMKKIESGIKRLVKRLPFGTNDDCIEGIMTTDKTKKEAEIDLGFCKIAGIAKGAGMIYPNMATMLSFIATDAKLDNKTLQGILKACVDGTFNRISIDGCRSTNDSVIIMANGMSDQIDRNKFSEGLFFVCASLARQIVEDGEGATKLIRIVVEGAKTKKDARAVACSIANSCLVKTAMYGCDPNVGRILQAIGNSKANIDPKKISIWLQGHLVTCCGAMAFFDREEIKQELKDKEIEIRISLGKGEEAISFLTCDLSSEYVKINARYS
ncbi:MAG: bifunctional glutamate N-acetyltransferase/amino-acid acetyltransferase ArgJ [bacterium]